MVEVKVGKDMEAESDNDDDDDAVAVAERVPAAGPITYRKINNQQEGSVLAISVGHAQQGTSDGAGKHDN
jgi:hypothetical protein